MKIQIISDTHYEQYPQLEDSLLQQVVNVENKKDTILVMAGDIASKSKVNKIVAFYKKFFKDVVHVNGNHEYYGYKIDSDFKSIVIDNVEFVMATLWTNFQNNLISRSFVTRYINDFHIIREFDVYKCENLFNQHFEFIKNCLSNPQAEKQVVVTHFAPSTLSIHEKYRGKQVLNDYFANSLENFILDNGPPIWIHGHCHDPFDYKIGDTRIICNPRGYTTEYTSYNPNLIVEI